ncbi:MAG: hypothetical protein ACRD2B_14460 [Terriglobia bacterium]
MSPSPDSSARPAESLHSLLAASIDYAGMYPPSSLSMPDALLEYSEHHLGPTGWMLNRFVVPSAVLEELRRCAATVRSPAGGWRISATMDDLSALSDFNPQPSGTPRMIVDAIEIRAKSVESITQAAAGQAREIAQFFEVPLDQDVAEFAAAAKSAGCFLKVRTGGLSSFPASRELAHFICVCVLAGVPFKLTAGLHHPLRGLYPLEGPVRGPNVPMHGFLNVMIATALARAQMDEEAVASALEEEMDPSAFTFTNEGAVWREHSMSIPQLKAARECLLSFGSCSVDEPVEGLRALALI